ncbi:N-acetylmuramoyl-L-alanine amidase-like domain-containing protein [Providencia sp. Me31A]|uniref:N-acetylmuramoyl-L-alanine amidase-like domain-containing protein n=1 Tax=Providencia sp. Me31A TaxID=3392637 RepID=UPI003D2977FE
MEKVLEKQNKTKGTSAERIDVLTQSFLNTPYNKQTLNMSSSSAEKLVINLKAMDCMTFIEYTEAFKRSKSDEQFRVNLTSIRYINQDITFNTRRHFFSDWAQGADAIAEDITDTISSHSVKVNKQLNLKNNGMKYISNYPIKKREIRYIPTKYLDKEVLNRLNSGDYIGVYSEEIGLDVSHVGIVIRKGNQIIFRNASSLRGNLKVSDSDLLDYLKGKKGILVFRSKLFY